MEERYKDVLLKLDVDMSLVEEAFEQRFEEIKLLRMRKGFPGLLPEDQRPEFRDLHGTFVMIQYLHGLS